MCFSYPSENFADANITSISYLKEQYKDFVIGLSDHTNDIKVPAYGVALGAQIIEKHYKINDSMDCIDKTVSITEKK